MSEQAGSGRLTHDEREALAEVIEATVNHKRVAYVLDEVERILAARVSTPTTETDVGASGNTSSVSELPAEPAFDAAIAAQEAYDRAHSPADSSCLHDPCPWHPNETRIRPLRPGVAVLDVAGMGHAATLAARATSTPPAEPAATGAVEALVRQVAGIIHRFDCEWHEECSGANWNQMRLARQIVAAVTAGQPDTGDTTLRAYTTALYDPESPC